MLNFSEVERKVRCYTVRGVTQVTLVPAICNWHREDTVESRRPRPVFYVTQQRWGGRICPGRDPLSICLSVIRAETATSQEFSAHWTSLDLTGSHGPAGQRPEDQRKGFGQMAAVGITFPQIHSELHTQAERTPQKTSLKSGSGGFRTLRPAADAPSATMLALSQCWSSPPAEPRWRTEKAMHKHRWGHQVLQRCGIIWRLSGCERGRSTLLDETSPSIPEFGFLFCQVRKAVSPPGLKPSACISLSSRNRCGSFTLIPAYTVPERQTMSTRNRSCTASILQACSSSSFTRQPSRVLIVDASPPWWTETCSVLCQALENFFFLASSLAGPVRLPLLSVFAISVQLECLLPFVQVKGNLTRLLSCVDELRSLPREGCIRQRAALLKQAVLDSLQQFRQYMCHTALGDVNSSCVEVTILTCQPGHAVLRQLEQDLQNSDLMSLRRLLVLHVTLQQTLSDRSPACSPETPSTEDPNNHEENLMLGTEMDLQLVEGTVVAVESALKMWLHDQTGDREHLHLLLPPSLTAQDPPPKPANSRPSPVCLKCDMQERLLSPALFPSTPDLGVKTESMHDFQPPKKSLTNQTPSPQRLRVVKVLHADGVCQSVLYGLPLVIRPTSCWQLDWDEMETNHQTFHALCHTLRTRDWFLLVRLEPGSGSGSGSGSDVSSYYVLQSSGSLSLLLKPVLTRELMLPCALPVSNEDPPLHALATVESSLEQLEKDPVFNPLCLDSNLYLHLRTRGLLTRSAQPFGAQGPGRGPRRDASRPPEGSTQRQGRQSQSRVRATVAPLPSIPPNKMSRPSLTLSHSRPRAPALCFQDNYGEDDPLTALRD